mgnify:CR=1 FL=1
MTRERYGAEPADRGLIWCDKCNKTFSDMKEANAHYFKEHAGWCNLVINERGKEMNTPSLTLLVKLGSLVIHIEEMLSDTGHSFDIDAITSLLNDKEVKTWIAEMNKDALLPVKRSHKGNGK